MWLESFLRQSRLYSSSSTDHRLRRAGLACLGMVVMGCGTLPAADATWSGPTGTQDWATGANWTPATPPGATTGTTNGDTATFNSNVAGTAITIDPNRNIKNITFAAGSAGAISIGSAGANLGNALLLTSGGALTTTVTTTSTVTVNAPLIVQPLSITGNGSYTFTNNSASLVSGNLNTADPNTYKIIINGNISGGSTTGAVTLNFGGNAGNRSNDNSGNEVNGVISNGLAGSVAVTVSTLNNQNGVWKFTNANSSYTGTTTLTQGTLIFTSIANAGQNSSLGAGSAIVIGNGAHFKYAGASASTDRAISGGGSFYNQSSGTTLTLTGSVATGLLFRGAGNFDITSVITGSGGFSRTDGGTVLFSNNNNSFTGDLSISDGAFRGATLLNSGVNSAFGRGALISLGQGSTTVGRLEYTGTSTSTDRSIIMRNDTAGSSGRGIIDVTTAGQTLTITGNVRTAAAGATAAAANISDLTLRGAGNGEIQGQIGGTTALPGTGTALKIVKDGTGTWTLSGVNNYTRETTVNAGVLNIRNSSALGAVLSNEAVPTATGAGTTVANNATLQLQNNISVGAELLTLSGTGAAGQSGALVNVSGTNNFAGDVILAANTTIASDSGRLNLTSATALNGSAASRTLTLGGAGDGSISSGLGANISTLTKTGAGLWTVGGTLAHTGATTVSAGTLNVTGSISGSGLVTVANTGTFAHAGTLAGGLTVANGGALSIGNAEIAGSTGTLTVNGATVLNNTSILRFDLGTSSDFLVANGALTLDGVLSVGKGAGFTAGTYKLIDYTSTLTNNGLVAGAIVGYDAVVEVDVPNQDVNLLVTALAGQYWDGGDTTADGIVDGGNGVWTNAGTNWTNADGSANTSWADAPVKVAFFDGAAGGTVTVQDAVSITGLQFGKDYTLAAGAGSLQLTNAATEVRVVPGATATIAAPFKGTGGINKTGEGTLVFTAAAGTNTYSGPTVISNGTAKIATTNSLPTSTLLTVGASGPVGGTGTVAALDMTTASQQVAGLNVSSNAASTLNSVLTIGAGQTLSVTGTAGLKIGIANTLQTTTQAVFTGGGALVVNNTSANFEAGLATTNANVPGVTKGVAPDDAANKNTIVANLAGLGSFTTNVNEFRVAHGLNAVTTLTLSNTANDITANTVNISNSAGMNSGGGLINGGSGLMILGAGTNVISANLLNIGVSKGVSTVQFASNTPGSPGTLVLAGKAPGTAIDITLGATLGTSTGASPGGTLDLRGHIATITADDLIIAKRDASGGGGATGSLSFDGGTFTANKIEIGTMGGGATGTAAGILTVSGGTFTVNSGGSFTMGTFANATNVGTATATLTISGGTFITNAAILEGGGTNSTTTNTVTTINLSGGILDMTGKDIGNATNTINNLNLTAGTLKDVGEINGGAAISKTGTGTLVLQGNAGYTGATTVSAGTLLVSNSPDLASTGSATGSNNVSVTGTATLGGNGRIAGNVTLASGTTLAPGGNATTIASSAPAPGLGTDTGTLRIVGTLDVAAGSTLALNLKTSGNHGLTPVFDPVTNRLTSVSGTSLDGGNDRIIVQGAVTLDLASTISVTAGTGFSPGYQDTFDLLDWSGMNIPLSYYDDITADGRRNGGTADNANFALDLPDLTVYNTGWFWDVSQFGTTGVIAIVPEPSRAMLALVGLAGLMLRRRRKA